MEMLKKMSYRDDFTAIHYMFHIKVNKSFKIVALKTKFIFIYLYTHHMLTTATFYFVELLHQLLFILKRGVFEDQLRLYGVLLWVRGQRLLGLQIPGGEGYYHLKREDQNPHVSKVGEANLRCLETK